MIYLLLIYEFFKVGLFAIGGGLATLPFLQNLSYKYPEWYSIQDLMNMVAVSESTPGPMGVNMSTYVGFTTGGLFGGICSTLGLVIPSIIIIIMVASIFKKFKNSHTIEKIFSGIRPASIGLIAAAGFLVMKEALFNIPLFKESGVFMDLFRFKSIIFGIILYIAFVKFNKHPIFYIAVAAIAGIIVKF